MPDLELPPEADDFVRRVRKVEGTASGSGYVTYGNKAFTPGKEFPQWEGVELGDGRKTHAAGPGQWQPDTWKEQKDKFKGYGVELDFSNETHQKAAIWDKGYEEYKKATGRDLREDLKADKVEWSKLAPTWQGFTPRVTRTDKPGGQVDPESIRYAQSRPHQSVWYLDPQELLDNLPPIDKDEADATQGKSLRKSLSGGDPIYDLPEIEVSDKGDVRKISSYDGRHRLKAMIEAGLTAVPVVIKGVEPGVRPGGIEGMTGKTMPIRFDPVPMVPAPTVGSRMALDRQAQFTADRQAQQPTPAKVYYNEAGQPFTLSGAPAAAQTQQVPPQRMPGEIPGVPRLSEMVGSVIEGAAQGGRMITGEEPVTRLLPENVVGAAAALGGTPLPPGSRFTPGLAQITPEGRNMLGAAQEARQVPMFQRGPPPMEQLTPERAMLARDAIQRNIPVTGPDNPATQVARERALQTNISRTFGEDAPALTPEVLARAQKRIGDRLNQIEQGHSVPFDPEFRADMIKISKDVPDQLTTLGQIDVVNKHLNNIMVDRVKTDAAKKAAAAAKRPGKPAPQPKEVLRSGLSGQQFGNLIHEKGPISTLANNPDSGVAVFGDRIETALRDLLQRRLPPGEAAEYQGLRYQYKNLKTAEKAVDSVGRVDPAKLDTSVNRAFPNRKRDKSAEMVKLSDIANEFVRKSPTPPAPPISPWTRGAEVAAGFAGGHMLGGPIGGAVGAALGAVGHEGARNLMRSLTRPRLTEALIERALREMPQRRNAINAMLSGRGANTMTQPGNNALGALFRRPPGPPQAPPPVPPQGMRQYGAPAQGWPGGTGTWAGNP